MKNIKKIKIINCPEYTGLVRSGYCQHTKISPLGIAQLTAYLREKGFVVGQDDLNVKVHYDNYYKKDNIDLSSICYTEKIIEHLKKGKHPGYRILAEKY